MEWLFDRNRAWIKEIWPFEAEKALETTATAKAPRKI